MGRWWICSKERNRRRQGLFEADPNRDGGEGDGSHSGSGNRFIERMYFKVREGVQAGDVEARYINTKLNVSDVLTKGASREVIAKLQAMLCGREPWPETPDAEGALRAQLADGWRPDW